MVRIKKNRVLVQIGTNNGTDAFNKIVKLTHPEKVILVEPNKDLNEEIYKNYRSISNMFLENVTITEVNKGLVKLVIPKIDGRRKKINGIHNYGHSHYSLLPMDNWGDKFKSFLAPSMTFNELCEKYGLTKIHFLQIDTEGYDYEIIKSIDFKKVDIDIIRYEKWGFSEDCYKRYGDKAKLYGINGMKDVANLLQLLGYTLIEEKLDMVATKIK